MGSLWEAMFTPTNATSARCYIFFKLNQSERRLILMIKNDNERASEALVIILGMLFLMTAMGTIVAIILGILKLFGIVV